MGLMVDVWKDAEGGFWWWCYVDLEGRAITESWGPFETQDEASAAAARGEERDSSS